MRKIDRLIVSELLPLWAFGVAIFSVLIMAGSFLFEITRFLSEGASIQDTALLVALLIPGVVAKTFAMAMLLSTLLAFGRLSGDSEIVALKAAGCSMNRIAAPVLGFGLAVGLMTFAFNTFVVPRASFHAWLLKEKIKDQLDGTSEKATTQALYEDGSLQGYVNARKFDIVKRTLNEATVIMVDKQSQPMYTIFATKMVYNGNEDWRLEGPATLTVAGGTTVLKLAEGAWPASVPKPKFSPEDLFMQEVKDLDSWTLEQLAQRIEEDRKNESANRRVLANYEFGYWNKFALPLAAVVFGLVGAPLGIRSHRTSAASGFWMSVLIIFCYMLLTNMMATMAQGGAIPSWAASFTPILIGFIAAAILIRQKNAT